MIIYDCTTNEYTHIYIQISIHIWQNVYIRNIEFTVMTYNLYFGFSVVFFAYF